MGDPKHGVGARRRLVWGTCAAAIALLGSAMAQPQRDPGSALLTPAVSALSASAAATPTATPTATEHEVQDPTQDPTSASPSEPSPVPTGAAATPADRTDPSWPRRPPWDACPRPVWPGELATGVPGGGRRVLVLGDSLTRESRRQMQVLLERSGWTPTFRCWGSRRLDWGLAQVARARELRQLPGFVIVALGTNDVSWESPQVTESRVRTLLDRLGPERQVLWVDLDVDHSAFSAGRADDFNRTLRRIVSKRPHVRVVPWEQQARRARLWRSDGIHYGPRGYRMRAEVVVAALDAHARSLAP